MLIIAVFSFSLCSSTLLFLNKLSIYYVEAPVFILLVQILFSAFVAACAEFRTMSAGETIKDLAIHRKTFFIISMTFLGTLYANIKTLQHANVETFIVVRASTPIAIAMLDSVFLGASLPCIRSWIAMFMIFCGTLGYVASDEGFSLTAYIWVSAWYALFCFDQIFIKHVVESIPMSTTRRVLLTNVIASLAAVIWFLVSGEYFLLKTHVWKFKHAIAVIISCIGGAAMSYVSFWLRSLVSASSFTVIGISCKIGTVALNLLIWENHASTFGISCLLVSVTASLFYEPAAKRPANTTIGVMMISKTIIVLSVCIITAANTVPRIYTHYIGYEANVDS